MHFSLTPNNFLTLLCACAASSDVVTTQGKRGQRKDFLCEWRTDTALGAVECVVKLENRFAIREARPRSDMRQRLPIQFTEKSMWICSEGETWRLLSMRDTRISSIYSSEPVTQFLMFVTSKRKPGLTHGLRLLTSTVALLVRSVVRESNGGQSGSDHLGSDLHGVAPRLIKPCLKICKHLKTTCPLCWVPVMCTGCVLHVWADFPHRSWTWNNGLHIGCAQPGSAEMLSFLRLCHAVWSRKDMWFYFFCRKSDT